MFLGLLLQSGNGSVVTWGGPEDLDGCSSSAAAVLKRLSRHVGWVVQRILMGVPLSVTAVL